MQQQLNQQKKEIHDLKGEVDLPKKQVKMYKGRIRFLNKIGGRKVFRLLSDEDSDD
jgi:hypothetical protein